MSQQSVEEAGGHVAARLSNRQLRLVRRYPSAFAFATRLGLLVPARWWPGRNVALLRALHPTPDVDMAQLFRDDRIWAAFTTAIGSAFRQDFECVAATSIGVTTYAGLDGLREAWLDWLKPWATYRTEVEEIAHRASRVLVLYRNFGCLEAGTEEVKTNNAAVWTFRDGRLARAEFYIDRAEALKAVGLRQ
jgi:ketosteroid isomerase-like protein